ncbi:hypothetical protein ACQKM9_17310 [Viridibacillus sp. NPDC093762]|uniref:hypothetical protein n=1 Tax=Viridibacillus sp. NPDC093762 TaxID=3390720 RepID=UPI003CFD0FCC
MVKKMFGAIVSLFVVIVVGSLMLEQFPQLQPLWEETQVMAKSLYATAAAKYGIAGAVILIAGVLIMFGTSKHNT